MLKYPELAMPRRRSVMTVCNGKREVWTDYEEAKAYFLELMMTAEGEDRGSKRICRWTWRSWTMCPSCSSPPRPASG